MENTIKVTREMMEEAVNEKYNPQVFDWKDNSFATRGAQRRESIRSELLKKLRSGGIPTTNEVVAYFGKGARFVE